MITLLDTFKSYRDLIAQEKPTSVDQRLDLWQGYIAHYPELEDKLKSDYTQEGIDWRTFALTRVFNHQEADDQRMLEAYDHLLTITENVISRLDHHFQMPLDCYIILYAGLCNSAGWVDYYDGKRAILIGIDKIAELKWHHAHKLETLIAHELCHVLHFEKRGIDIVDPHFVGSLYLEGIWRLYEEGLAMYYQDYLTERYALVSKNEWTDACRDQIMVEDRRGKRWSDACRQEIAGLKNAYLIALKDTEIGTRDFYGDWYQVMGLSDVGYYLGRTFIADLAETLTFDEIACLSPKVIEEQVVMFLSTT